MSAAGWRRWMALIILLALTARLGAIFTLKRWDSATPGINRQLALGLLDNGSFTFREHGYFGPSSITTPPYPVVLAAIFRVFGPKTPNAYFAALALNAIFGALCAAVIAKLVQRLTQHATLAVVAGLLVAVWPPQIFAATFAQPMALATLCVATTCLFWVRSLQNHSLLPWIGFSLAAALAALIEPPFLLVILLAAGITPFIRNWPADVRVRNMAVLLLACVLLLLPWIARNHAVHQQWLMTTTFWERVWAGANPNATGSDRLRLTPERHAAAKLLIEADDSSDLVRAPMMQIDSLSPAQRSALRDLPEAQRESLFRKWASEWLTVHGGVWLGQLPARLIKVWWIDYDHPMSRNPLALIPRSLAALLGLVGLLTAFRARLPIGFLTLVFIATLIFAGATVASVKQMVLIEPLQIAIACAGVAAIVRKRANRAAASSKLAEAAA